MTSAYLFDAYAEFSNNKTIFLNDLLEIFLFHQQKRPCFAGISHLKQQI